MKAEITRENALELLKKYNKDSFHLQHAYTVEGVMKWYAKELGFAEDKLAEKWFGKDATTEIVEEGIKKYTAIKLLFVSYNLGSVLPRFSDFIRKTFNFKIN